MRKVTFATRAIETRCEILKGSLSPFAFQKRPICRTFLKVRLRKHHTVVFAALRMTHKLHLLRLVGRKKPPSEREGDHEVVEGACVTLGKQL